MTTSTVRAEHMYDLDYDDLLSTIHARFGITLRCFNSGGGCLIWQSRLESRHWVWINDWDQGIMRRDRRLATEAAGLPVGWFVGVYTPAGDTPPVDRRALAGGQRLPPHRHCPAAA